MDDRALEGMGKERFTSKIFPRFRGRSVLPSRHDGLDSTFATVRLRHWRTTGSGNTKGYAGDGLELCRKAESGWRKLDGYKLILLVEAGVKFVNGEQVDDNVA